VLLLIARVRGVKMFAADGTLGPDCSPGLLFGVEFLLIWRGSVADLGVACVVFFITAVFVALVLFSSRRTVRASHGAGWLGFAAWRWRSRAPGDVDANVLLGDLLSSAAARCGRPQHAGEGHPHVGPPERSATGGAVDPILGAGGLDFGRNPDPGSRTPGAIVNGYQALWVVGLTVFCCGWAWSKYSASNCRFYLYHPWTPCSYSSCRHLTRYSRAALLVIAGLYLVNRPSPVIPVAIDPLLNCAQTDLDHEQAVKPPQESSQDDVAGPTPGIRPRKSWSAISPSAGGAPIVVQSMTNTDTADIEARSPGRGPFQRPVSELVPNHGDRDETRRRGAAYPRRPAQARHHHALDRGFPLHRHKLLADHPACAEALDIPDQSRQCRFRTSATPSSPISSNSQQNDKPVRIGAKLGVARSGIAHQLMMKTALLAAPKDVRAVTRRGHGAVGVAVGRPGQELGMPRTR